MDKHLRKHIEEIIDFELKAVERHIDAVITAENKKVSDKETFSVDARVEAILGAVEESVLAANLRIIEEIGKSTSDAAAFDLSRDMMQELLAHYRDRLSFALLLGVRSNDREAETRRIIPRSDKTFDLVQDEVIAKLGIAAFRLGAKGPSRVKASPVSNAELKRWWEGLSELEQQDLPEANLWSMAKARFPGKFVSRDRVREFTKGRSQGRPRARGK